MEQQRKREEVSKLILEQNFQEFLKEELLRRCRVNPRYSLRAFARILQTEPSFLSKIINGKRTVTLETFQKFSSRIGLTPTEVQNFESSLKNKPGKGNKKFGEMHYDPLTSYQFSMISDWCHYAIRQLIKIKNFDPNPRAVAAALGIGITEAKGAIGTLVRFGYIKKINGKWMNVKPSQTTLGSRITTPALRVLQRNILKKAIEALDDIPMEQRDQTAMTLAFDSKLLPEARKRITKFRRELTEFLETKSDPDEVFHLSISLYPVTNLKSKQKKKEGKYE